MLSNNELKAVCSVTDMANKLGLSRARFYQLQKVGVQETYEKLLKTPMGHFEILKNTLIAYFQED